MSIAYAYRRVSTVDQEKNGFSLPAQEVAAKAYYEALVHASDKYEGLNWGGFFTDGGESAWKKEFSRRENGSVLCQKLKRGDHIIFCRLDRAFRNIRDYVCQMQAWREGGIIVHFVDQWINMDTANGRLLGNILSSVSQWESDMKSERCKEVARNRKKNMQPVNQKTPTGMQLVGSGKNKRFVMDPSVRHIFRYIQYCRDHKGMTFMQISDSLETCLARRDGRAYIPHEHFKNQRPWKTGRVQTAYRNMGVVMPPLKPSERVKVWNAEVAT